MSDSALAAEPSVAIATPTEAVTARTLLAEREGVVERAEDGLGQAGDVDAALQPDADDEELVPADARDEVARPHGRDDPAGRAEQELIADLDARARG